MAPWLASRILELGVGNGKTLAPLQAAGHEVVGLDVSWNVLGRIQGPRVLADASALPFVDASFQTVLDLHCTGHLLANGRVAAHREQARVLAPGGHVIVQRLHPEDLRATKGAEVEAGTRELADGRRTHFSDETSLRADLEAAGLEVVHCTVDRHKQKIRGGRAQRAQVMAVARAD
ncbi:MAG: class I SAM-dependent methyltransferase [Thermoplasmatota archaeon]